MYEWLMLDSLIRQPSFYSDARHQRTEFPARFLHN